MSKGCRGSIPCGLLGAVVLAVAVEALLAGHDLDLCRVEDMNWRRGHRAAGQVPRDCATLCLGTSMAQVGVLPRVVAHRTGRPAWGVATVGAQPAYTYYMFRRALASGARPSAVVLDFHPTFLELPADRTPAVGWADVLDTRDALDMAWNLRDASFFAEVLLDRALPSLYYRGGVRRMTLAALRGESGSFRKENLIYLRNYNRNLGALVNRKNPNYRGEVTDNQKRILLGDRWRPDPVKLRYTRKFLDLAAAHGIRVYWLMIPFAPALQAGREQKGLDAAYERFARSLLRSYPNLAVLDGRRSGYEPSVFMDACHLDPDGAFVLSRDVGDALARHDGSRWAALPAFRASPVDVPAEGMAETYAAVAAGMAGSVRK